MKWLWWLLLVLFLALGGAGLYFLFLVLFDPGEAFPGVQDLRAGVWVTLGLWLAAGAVLALLRRLRRAPTTLGVNRRLEQKILAYARRSGGRLSVAEVALNTRCTVQEADMALQELVRQNVATVLYTSNMEAVYVIGGFDEAAQTQAGDLLNPPTQPKRP